MSIPVTLTVCLTLDFPFDVRFVVSMTMIVFDEFRSDILLGYYEPPFAQNVQLSCLLDILVSLSFCMAATFKIESSVAGYDFSFFWFSFDGTSLRSPLSLDCTVTGVFDYSALYFRFF